MAGASTGDVSEALVQIAGAGKRPCCTVETSSLEHGIPHCRRKSTLDTQMSQSELSLADAMHQFIGLPAIVIAAVATSFLEAQHTGDLALFLRPDGHLLGIQICLQVLRRPQLRLGGQQSHRLSAHARRGETRHSRPQ